MKTRFFKTPSAVTCPQSDHWMTKAFFYWTEFGLKPLNLAEPSTELN